MYDEQVLRCRVWRCAWFASDGVPVADTGFSDVAVMDRLGVSEVDRVALIRAFLHHAKRTYQRLGLSEPEP